MTRAADGSRTVYAYDALGNTAGAVRIGPAQALDFDPQDFTLAGVIAMDAYVLEETPAWKEESDLGLSAHGVPTAWWDCSASVSHLPGRGAVTTSVTRAQLTGLSTACVSRTVTTGADGVSAIAAEALDAANARKTATLRNTATAGHETSVTVAGRVTGGTNALGAAVAHLYDGFARRTSAEETAGSRTLRTLAGYHADGGTAFTDEIVGAATNRTRYSQRQYLDPPAGAYLVTVTDPLGNVATNFHSGDGALYRSGGAVYPTATARDADGRQAELRTWRDEAGQPDATRWHYDLASGIVTNKVYADGLGPAYAYLPDGRLSQRTWARGVETPTLCGHRRRTRPERGPFDGTPPSPTPTIWPDASLASRTARARARSPTTPWGGSPPRPTPGRHHAPLRRAGHAFRVHCRQRCRHYLCLRRSDTLDKREPRRAHIRVRVSSANTHAGVSQQLLRERLGPQLRGRPQPDRRRDQFPWFFIGRIVRLRERRARQARHAQRRHVRL
jgi:hypothetical protein